MRMIQIGKKSLRLLVLTAIVVTMLCGCAESKYVPVETLALTETAIEDNEMVTFTIGDTEAAMEQTESAEEDASGQTEEAAIVYEEIHDWVVVVADVLNVRAADNTDARIYIQLKTGDVLERIGYHEEWSQVIYDGDVAYVATAMVDVKEVPAAASVVAEEPIVPFNGHIVAIDAGHQAKANAEKEPIGPGSSTSKAKMPAGAVGTVSGVKEYELTLTVAKKLDEELKARGYRTVMIRTGHDVNLSNAQRSAIANESDAEIFIRLHANEMENSGIYGALAMCMTEYNPYNSELHEESYALSKKIINNICALTGTKNRGVQKVDNSSAINWCEIPVSVVEMGFLTNPDEDRWLQEEEYQGKIVKGIAEAVDSYFAEEN